MESRFVVSRTGRSGEWGMTANGYGVSFRGNENIMEIGTFRVVWLNTLVKA